MGNIYSVSAEVRTAIGTKGEGREAHPGRWMRRRTHWEHREWTRRWEGKEKSGDSLQWVFIKVSRESWRGMHSQLRDWLHHTSFDQRCKHAFLPALTCEHASPHLWLAAWLYLISSWHAFIEAVCSNVSHVCSVVHWASVRTWHT